jgi:bifunctional DNA-binding transcriptional regulator/antitoxin component of YhaV-PrlF toxin-antitoxin module
MPLTLKNETNQLVVPASVRRRAGIKLGDQLKFKASRGLITITPVEAPTYKPTKSELAAIRKGEAEIARGDSVSLESLLHDLERGRRKVGPKTARKASR